MTTENEKETTEQRGGLSVENALLGSCLDCRSHRVINDPDPNDSFCDDDLAVVCTKTPNDKRDTKSRYVADHSEWKVVEPSIRPYNLRKESVVPSWCPKRGT